MTRDLAANSDLSLASFQASDALNALDLHFARFITGFDAPSDPRVTLAAALLSHRVGQGDLCIDLHQEAEGVWPPDHPNPIRLPRTEEWIEALTAANAVAVAEWGDDERFRPLVLDDKGRLYLHKYHLWELELARDLVARHQTPAEEIDEARLRSGLQRLFGASERPDRQRLAAMVAVLRRFAIISGGPGTGKTTTVVKILALLLEQATGQGSREPIIALAAPTGKAAVRLQDSIRRQKAALSVEQGIREAIPEKVVTLHRLLGARPDSVRFRHDRENPLPVDILVVDEASMVDLALMARLLQALPEHARLILLGDKDQLASVEAGAVLGDLCRDAAGFSEGFAECLDAIAGAAGDETGSGRNPNEGGRSSTLTPTPLPRGEGLSPIADALVVLDHSYRFSDEAGIGRLARAFNAGDSGSALSLIEDPATAQVAWLDPEQDAAQYAADRYAELFSVMRQRQTPVSELFRRFDAFRCLCALREGDHGVNGLNQRIEQRLTRRDLISRNSGPWYAGRPVMITRNDYNLKLFNGDIGLLLPDADDPERLKAWFPAGEDGFRAFAPARLPAHETAFAITVHKSQGSEFDDILLVLPPADAPVITRELLYTALTRAKQQCLFSGPRALLAGWIERRVERVSGLSDRLHAVNRSHG